MSSFEVEEETAPITKSFLLDKIQLRFLEPSDIDELKFLCRDWFPIEYPEGWYKDVTLNQKYFSLAATFNNEIIGIIVAEVKDRLKCNKEDSNILGYWYSTDIKVAYILILGVRKQYRRYGIASLLLDNFLSQLTTEEGRKCKAVYLHVLSANTTAVTFYERRNFQFHRMLLKYYNINNVKMDGFSYVLYINGGQPPWSLLDCMKSVSECIFSKKLVCAPARWMFKLCWVPCGFLRNNLKGVRNT